jgi:hypothetical protein
MTYPALQKSPFVRGVIPSARMAYSANPANGDVMAIGTPSFQFVTALGAQTTATQIKVLGSAALSLASAINAINGVADANVVIGSTPPLTTIFADAQSATVLRIRFDPNHTQTPTAGVIGSTALTCTITAGATAWSAANLNVSGKAETDQNISVGRVAITAAMITNTSYQIELPFTPTIVEWNVTASTGVLRSITDAVTISGNAISIALAGGASPATQPGDLFSFTAIA